MNIARAALVLSRKAFHSMAFTKAWLARLSRPGTHLGRRSGDGNAAVGEIGIMPAPTPLAPTHSAAEKPANAASPAARIASQPSPASMMALSQDAALSLTIAASARAVALKPPPLATTQRRHGPRWARREYRRRARSQARRAPGRCRAWRRRQASRLVSGVDQATAQRGEWSRIALSAIRRDDKLHDLGLGAVFGDAKAGTGV